MFGVNSNDEIYYRLGTNENPGSVGTGWQVLSGSLTHISVGVEEVWGVNSIDEIWRMEDITFLGGQIVFYWEKVDGKLKHVKINGSPLYIEGTVIK